MKKKSTFRSAFLTPRAPVTLLCMATACSILTGTLPVTAGKLAFVRPDAPARVSQGTLTFEERVSYQRAIEEVYWRHRIWPKERKDPKPSLDAVMSQAQLEKKVEDYLRNSRALGDYWQRPITAEQLQAEMDRMVQHTKQPEVLGELFEALGNDAFVIAECLARPALSERLVRNWYVYDQRFHGALRQRAQADLQGHLTIEQMKATSGKCSEIELVKDDNANEQGSFSAGHSVKLNTDEWEETVQKLMGIFGNGDPAAPGVSPAKGAPLAHLKTGILSPLQEDEQLYYSTEVIEKGENRLKLATVTWLKEPFESWRSRAENQKPKATVVPNASYSLPIIPHEGGCIHDTWTATPGPPDGHENHTAVWTGSEMIIWGGDGGDYLSTGARYNPSTDTWIDTSTTNAPTARRYHTAVWTGTDMIVWGGQDENLLSLNSGGRYNPGTDTWTATSATNAPTGTVLHAAVWSGSEMIVWGGYDGTNNVNTGGKYNPNTDSWTPTSSTNTPSGRYTHTAVWTGSEMIIWGGYDGTNNVNTGGRYNPGTNSWTATNTTNAPFGRGGHRAVWTGNEMIVWGGLDDSLNYLNTGGRYNPSTDSWIATSTTNSPDGRSNHTVVWTGDEMIVWGGFFFDGDYHYLNAGGKYNPNADSWTATDTTNAPTGRAAHTAVWSGNEMLIWGGTTAAFVLNTGGRYNPGINSWTNTGANGAPSGRSYHAAIWTGTDMIVWGGLDENYAPFLLDTGGKYNPITDSWTSSNSTNAPSARYFHTAVWSGSEMIVWGGEDENSVRLNTGGRYNPITDSWIATNTTNAPSGRITHTAVWAGNEMIVWGGIGVSGDLNTGGRYNPIADTWTTTSTTDAPSPREAPTAVWTDSEMIVWGGYHADHLNTGGRYSPSTDSWTATSVTNAPIKRSSYTAVWTGIEMIIWGGLGDSGFLNTGGRYNPVMDSWTLTDATTQERGAHTAVWTGSEMIAWGGWNSLGNLNTGGRYNPTSDSWIATSTTNAPTARINHTAVWTGSEMIVWGGYIGGYLSSGGRYCAKSGPTPTPTPSPTATPRATPRPRPTPHPRPIPR